ncbi:MAG: microcin transport system ATP-binding protein [Alphaproteobacteria bacterium]|jgi:microcin C transport system ATP-binding protein|nr:microcin transport system ATP-binding protein [Alphaproteobacteria bacterium]
MDMTTEPLLTVQDLSIAFSAGTRTTLAVDRISFSIKKGETLALVGESGSGKSATALSIMKLLPYPAASHPSGQVLFKGQDLLSLSERKIREIRGADITIIFQEPMTSLNPLHTIEQQIAEILLLHRGMTGQPARARILELLNQVGIPNPETRLKAYPHQLSGGQRQRVMIAMALANEPDLLIADEPTTALDVTVQAQILNLLKELQGRLGMAMLFITHDLGIVRKIADRVCVMKDGKIVEENAVAEIFKSPQHPYTRALLAAEPHPHALQPNPNGPIVLKTDDLKVWFPIKRGVTRKIVGYIKAVDGVSVEVRKGETLGVVGESGSGKTTLGLALMRLISSDGPIVFMGKELQELRFKEMRPHRRNMQIVFQDPYGSLSPRMSVSDIIQEGMWIHLPHLSRHECELRVIKALEDVGLDPETRHRYPHEFSGGQRQRIAVARAIVLEPTFVVLDEPTSALDMLIQAQMVDLLCALQKRHDLTYMFISHDLRVVAAMSSSLMVMKEGKVMETGPAAEIFKSPKTAYTRALFAAAFNLEASPEAVVAE